MPNMDHSPYASENSILDFAKSSLRTELTVAKTYLRLADITKDQEFSKKLHQIAQHENHHAEFWRKTISERGGNPNDVTSNSFKVFIMALIYRLLGAGLSLKLLESDERKMIQRYLTFMNRGDLQNSERSNLIVFIQAELAHEEMFLQYEEQFKFFIRKISTIFTQTSGGLVVVLSTAIGFSQVYKDSVTIGVVCLLVGVISAVNTAVGFYFFERTGQRIKEDILAKISATCSYVPEAYLERVKKYLRMREYSDKIIDFMVEEAVEKGFIEKIIAEEQYGFREELKNPVRSAFWAGVFRIIAIVLPLVPFFLGIPIFYAVFGSVLITVMLVSISGSLVAIAADISVRDKITELLSGLVLMVTLTYILGAVASYLLALKL